MEVLSLNVGERKQVSWRGRTVETGIFKSRVDGPLYLEKEDVLNDVVVDRKNHGGIEQAVYAYSYTHYDYWRSQYPNLEIDFGFFGENLTVSNLEETEIRVGDVFELGEAVIQVTKPRQPCFKLGIRFSDQAVIKQMWQTTKCGIYFKILQTGKVATGDNLKLLKKEVNSPTVAQVFSSKRT